MKKVFIPKMGPGSASASRFFRAKLSPDGDNAQTIENDEIKSIEQIGEQVVKFKTQLGEKADKQAFEDLENEIKTLKEGLETLTSKQIVESIEKINLANLAIHKQLVELQEEKAEKAEQNSGKAKKVGGISTEQVKQFVKEMFGEDAKKGEKQAPSSSQRIEIQKAPETFGYPTFFQGDGDVDITPFTGRYIDPTLYKRKRKRNLILDNFPIQNIGVPSLVYLEKVEIGDTNPTSGDPGSADWILSGQAKPKRSFRVTSKEVTAKKVAIFGTVEDKLLRDVASLENWIREDFDLELREKINDGLLNNNPAVNALAPLGMKTNAIQYSATPAFTQTVDNTTYIDALIAVFALFIYNKEEAAEAFVSSDVYFRILSLKDTQARYLNNPLIYTNAIGELYIAGVHVMWADEEDVPSDNLLVTGVDLGFKIKSYGAMVFERGLNGENFREDKTSYRGYQEFLTYIPENRFNSVFYDTWVNIFAAISKPVI